MKEKIIAFKTAKLAKDSGFNIITRHFYNSDNPLSFNIKLAELGYWKSQFIGDKEVSSYKVALYVDAPTQSLLQKWLQEIHDIHIVLTINPFSDNELYGFKIYTNKEVMRCVLSEELDTSYEEALESALYKSLELIK